MPEYISGNFVISAEKLSQCPTFNLPEFALLGRSNVGKSSFINRMSNNKKLAKTSNTPGKTRLINFFNMSEQFIIADLPGYGYAKISKETQARWQKHLEEYLLNRSEIKSLIQFIDARHDIQKNDIQMREWVEAYSLPIFTIVTKVDYVKRSEIQKIISRVKKEFAGEVLPFSANDGYYVDNVKEYILNLCRP